MATKEQSNTGHNDDEVIERRTTMANCNNKGMGYVDRVSTNRKRLLKQAVLV